MLTIKGYVSGRVQGVGFRYFVQETATLLDITGYARNLDDGRVEFVLQGEESNIETALIKIKKGPPYAKVESLSYAAMGEGAIEQFSHFEIRL